MRWPVRRALADDLDRSGCELLAQGARAARLPGTVPARPDARRLPADRRRHDVLRFLLDHLQVLGTGEALRVDLVDVLGTGRPRGEPARLRGHLEPAERGSVTRRTGHP